MKIRIYLLTLFSYYFLTGNVGAQEDFGADLTGKWVRMSQTGPVALVFKPDGIVEVDFNNDQTVDVVSVYSTEEDTIEFSDNEGAMCPEPGRYIFRKNEYYLSFDLIDDMCNGRVKMTMGFWTKPNFAELLDELAQKISETQNVSLNLSRARIYLALGKSSDARNDLDIYLNKNPDNARALINRAGTRFPADMKGVVEDCNEAISLEPDNKNAFFLRGLAFYELGQKEKACADFSRAIELGFSILRIAEEQRCAEYWKK
jgi:tetratricopeptide (TPR) repeat protein